MTLSAAPAESQAAQPEPLDLDAALDERQAHLVELRYFGGLTVEEAARAMRVSLATAHREWAMAKAWLFRPLKRT